jgi:hypothetical protein
MAIRRVEEQLDVSIEIRALLSHIGVGKVDGVAYDTAWAARLAPRYPRFEASLEWLRQNQHEDGSWGAPLVHYHDRFISTLAAVIALRELSLDRKDERRVKRGENALWRLVGQLQKDDSDTVGFPLLAIALANEAEQLGLEIPHPPIRHATAYRAKVEKLLNAEVRQWRKTTLTYSLEGFRAAITAHDDVFEDNHSVSISPAATAAYLLTYDNPNAVRYLESVLDQEETGAMSQFSPVDAYETIWALNHLRIAGAISSTDPTVRSLLNFLWARWSPEYGMTMSSYYQTPEIDDTAATFTLLRWGGYPVSADVFEYYEMDNHFACFRGETNPSVSANIRLLAALKFADDHPKYDIWVNKIIEFLYATDQNGSFWSDKWHASPYYVTSIALNALRGIDNELARGRLRWILRTQNDDGGWGYLGQSTPEETAYCMEGLMIWDRHVERIEPSALSEAGRYLRRFTDLEQLTPLWIGKSLYTPPNIVKAGILGAMYAYESRKTT